MLGTRSNITVVVNLAAHPGEAGGCSFRFKSEIDRLPTIGDRVVRLDAEQTEELSLAFATIRSIVGKARSFKKNIPRTALERSPKCNISG